ncbi:type II toxin-antitoxin system VapC family toxin [uncultured Jatrophihabitans sp.]|uniref:type II toxin-antitoxin system VapC family toxin n=1 Tax=uncultured Jatrophihabitans sp. TaxID=1610747 RepID=UPI0035C9B1CD
MVALADDGPDGHRVRQRLRGERLAAPQLIDLEVGSVLRRLNRSGQIGDRRAEMAINDLAAIPLQRAGHPNLLGRCWELRQNLTFYDSAYVALAEALQVTLLTGDRRLSRAAGPSCPIETITP